jgi:hypothetical protein
MGVIKAMRQDAGVFLGLNYSTTSDGGNHPAHNPPPQG